jgi:shikimate dehydrogenase
MTVIAGVVGWPIAHSLSPLLHNAWIKAAGIDARYEAMGPEDPQAFRRLIALGRTGNLTGINVTAPYKELALALSDTVSETARRAGSANLLVFSEGRITADSTDGLGLMRALQEQAPHLSVAGQVVVILGAGGAARAAVAALLDHEAEVVIFNRTLEKAQTLIQQVGGRLGSEQDFRSASLVVNALTVPPTLDFDLLSDGTVMMDMTYRPLETPFLKAARERGLTGVDGLAMLIGQAHPSFRTFFNIEPPSINVRALALASLGEAA